MNEFTKATGFDFLFDLNLMLRDGDELNSTNIENLLAYNKQHGYNVSWELGNESNRAYHHFNVSLSGEQVAKNFIKLRSILKKDPYYEDAVLVGPDNSLNGFDFLKKFVQNIEDVIDATTFHFYQHHQPPIIQYMLSPEAMNEIEGVIKTAKDITMSGEGTSTKPLWIGESGTIPGIRTLGCPKNIFAFSILIMDKLGLAARTEVSLLVRQSLIGRDRGVITLELQPGTDFWTSVIYKRIVGTRVLNVDKQGLNVHGNETKNVRLYAHCSKTGSMYNYPPGSITLFGVNVDFSKNYTLNLGAGPVDIFLFTPGDDKSFFSTSVALNGNVLEMTEEDVLPDLNPKKVHTGQKIVFPSLSYAYFVLPEANAKICL